MPLKKYTCILFDLDHTLWDYDTNSKETLLELFEEFKLPERGLNPADFLPVFYEVNLELWDQYDRGLLPQEVIRRERFDRVFRRLGLVDTPMSLQFSEAYVRESPKKPHLVEGAREVLDYLAGRYQLVIVTNGFEEIQSTKVRSAGIEHYFSTIVTSARAGHKKPARAIFDFALAEHGHRPNDAIMVGDNLLTDMAGAIAADIDAVFYNPARLPHDAPVEYEIEKLAELRNFL